MYSRWKLYKNWRLILLAVVLTGCGTSTTPVVKPTAAPIVTQTIIMQPESDESLQPGQNVPTSGKIQDHCPEMIIVRLLNNLGELVSESNLQTRLEQQACIWETSLRNSLPDGTSGWIVAGLPSAAGNYLDASDAVAVTSGSSPSGAFVTITNPEPYQTIYSEKITISGRGAGLFENHLVVQLEDEQGAILATAPVILEAQDMGGEGNWQIELTIPKQAGKPGRIVASASSPKDGSLLTIFAVPVIYGSPIP